MTLLPTRVLRVLAAALVLSAGLANAKTPADALADMLAFDAVYIPALSLTTNGGKDAASAARADAALQRLAATWPAQRRQLAAAWPRDAAWARDLGIVQRQIEEAQGAVKRRDWAAAHEALEPVRITLMKARQARAMPYYVDRLTAFHEPMEALALAGSTWKPEQLTPARRQALDAAFGHARALWRAVEREPVDATALALSATREQQLRQGVADETAALSRLSTALRGDDAAALLKAAAAIKPPYARTFTAFGLAEGESASGHAH